ncbi:hypothetical protein M0R45_015006 [Rubus argutus]|uniref:Reverse transcriptase n=1 Tax=Rubus argutus TaxID=59490 RepID=A0AAW1XP88_RUBAR
MGKLKTRLGMDGVLCVARNEENGGVSGGLCFFWKSSIEVSFISSSFFHIDIWVKWTVEKECRVTGFYGHPVTAQRSLSWDLLRDLVEEFSFSGYEFTWDNRRSGNANVKERIDRGFGNFALLQQWGGFTAHHLVAMSSDHCPLLIEEDPISGGGGGGVRSVDVLCLRRCGCRMRIVGKVGQGEKFGRVRRTVVELREELDKLQRLAPSVDNLRQRQEKEALLEQVLEKEEIMWAQRSRVNWLRHGDRNTRFFHQYARHRGRINTLPGILDEENKWHTGSDEVGVVLSVILKSFSPVTGGSYINAFLMVFIVGFRWSSLIFFLGVTLVLRLSVHYMRCVHLSPGS